MERQTFNEAAAAGLHAGAKSLQVLTTRRAEFHAAAVRSRDQISARCRHLADVVRQTFDEAAIAGLHAGTKPLQVLATHRAEFAAGTRAGSRTADLRNSRGHSEEHCYEKRAMGDSSYHHLGVLPAPPCRMHAIVA
ncbi:MAG TPA: hypothetical protein VEC94_08410 [Pseudolabrys sp.]|nr:hypothetical protein [Pseudolabrys sp.]